MLNRWINVNLDDSMLLNNARKLLKYKESRTDKWEISLANLAFSCRTTIQGLCHFLTKQQ